MYRRQIPEPFRRKKPNLGPDFVFQSSCGGSRSSVHPFRNGLDRGTRLNHVAQWRLHDDPRWWLVWSDGERRWLRDASIRSESVSSSQVITYLAFSAFEVSRHENAIFLIVMSLFPSGWISLFPGTKWSFSTQSSWGNLVVDQKELPMRRFQPSAMADRKPSPAENMISRPWNRWF